MLAGRVALAAGRPADAAERFERLLEAGVTGPRRRVALMGAADAWERIGRPDRAARRLVELLDGPVEPAMRERATARLRRLVRTALSPVVLDSLVTRHPGSVVAAEASLALARRDYARGDYDRAWQRLAEFIDRFPRSDRIAEARRLLDQAAARRVAPGSAPDTPVVPGRVGVVLPVTGRGARVGRAFDAGVELALREYNAGAERPVELVRADSHGEAIAAVLAVRRLVVEDGVVGVLGPVFGAASVAGAVEANAWRTPIVLPVSNDDDIVSLGPWVFQTRIPLTLEATAVARLAVRRLLLRRVAVVAPRRGERRHAADRFRDTVERLGGEVVAFELYEPGETDFREQLDPVREAAPDAIFAPGSVEELLLLLPQIKYYDMQVQLLGLSNWDSARLLRLARGEIEGAVFPREWFLGADRAAWERLRAELAGPGRRDVDPVSAAAYFGARVLLRAFAEGVVSREDLREWLRASVAGTPDSRDRLADAMAFRVVEDGRPRPFTPPAASEPFN